MKIKKTIATLVAAVAVASTFAVNASAKDVTTTMAGTTAYLRVTVGGSSANGSISTPYKAGYRYAYVITGDKLASNSNSVANGNYVSTTATRTGHLVTSATGTFKADGSTCTVVN